MKQMILKAGELQVTLEQTESGVRLSRIHDGKTGADLLTGSGYLFLLTAERLDDGTQVTVSSDRDFRCCELQSCGSVYTVSCTECPALPGVSVIVTAQTSAQDNRITFSTVLHSENKQYTLTSCDYPALWFDVKDSVKFLSPYGCGEAIPSDSVPFGHGFHSEQDYPSYGVSFQFMAAWDEKSKRCLYYGLHDPVPASKKFCFLREVNAPQMCIKSSQPLCNIDRGENGQSLYGCCVWQLTDGDWYDATLLYRDWMEKNASWVPETDENGRTDISWLKDIDAWFLVHIDNEHFADEILEAAKDLGVKSAVHLYLWHQIPFDNDYPHYFPEKPFVKREVKRLQDAGIRVIPYVNGRLWDTRDKGLEDWQFTAKALPFATKDRHGKPFTESYSAKEANGEHTVLAVMCPTSAIWTQTMQNVTSRCMNDVGFDGVYLDQIAAAKAQPCCDRSHAHAAGGGGWWSGAYSQLTALAKNGKEGAVLATECTAEQFMKNIQGYLSWLWVKNDQVPAFPVLYSDKVATFGICYHGFADRDPDAMVIFYAQSLLFGEQMGWLAPKTYNVLPERDFFKKCVRMRQTLHDVLQNGIMLRPPVLKDDAPRLHSEKASQAYFNMVDYPAVQGTLWQSRRDGRQYLLLCNAQKVQANVQLETEFPDGVYTLHGEDQPLTLTVQNGRASVTLPAHSAVYAATDAQA